MLGCSSCVKFSKTVWIFSSCALKFLRSLNCTSFHTTSTPSSVSIARWAQSMPGTSRCSTWNREEKLLFKATWDDHRVNLIGVAQREIICRKSFNGYFYPTRAFHSALYAFADVWEHIILFRFRHLTMKFHVHMCRCAASNDPQGLWSCLLVSRLTWGDNFIYYQRDDESIIDNVRSDFT